MMFRNLEPMDGESRAILIGVLGVVALIVGGIALWMFLAGRSDAQKNPARIARDHNATMVQIAREHSLVAEVAACRGLSTDAAITLCLKTIPKP